MGKNTGDTASSAHSDWVDADNVDRAQLVDPAQTCGSARDSESSGIRDLAFYGYEELVLAFSTTRISATLAIDLVVCARKPVHTRSNLIQKRVVYRSSGVNDAED
ncbi:hypothetical protein Poli38472_009175 [Pythium oligandrum]|uniref:Uncharacterized protein n=1 Tax=Pythium oligandrum TaxID=41045 RepID=A0A8K1FNV3_PYTOL|nr:hypothetical protein Poli38472_009175 [Pythium oligandrum]|eukprot:TMW65008.1 hypothetical protein Poli38472_009175 [Pythium oligandrum]